MDLALVLQNYSFFIIYLLSIVLKLSQYTSQILTLERDLSLELFGKLFTAGRDFIKVRFSK